MAGHSKWKRIKNKKAATDAKKSKTFSKIIRLIIVEAKKSDGNANSPGLKTAIEKARAANVPSDNIERAIKKALEVGVGSLEPVTYETYGPGGCAIIIEALTGNRNKTAAEIRYILSTYSLELAGSGGAAWAFEKTFEGWVPKSVLPLSEADAEILSELVEKLEENDEIQEVYTNAE